MIGIVLAAYQPNPTWLMSQIRSIQSQTWVDWKLVVTFDSKLSDFMESVQGLDGWRSILGDSRIQWIQNPNPNGFAQNFGFGVDWLRINEPSVQAIAFADQDDYWIDNKLEVSIKYLRQCPPLSLVHTDAWIWHSEDEMPSTGVMSTSKKMWSYEQRHLNAKSTAEIAIRNIVTGASCLFDAKIVFQSAQEWPTKIKLHDQWVALLASAQGGVYEIKSPTYFYRQHEGNAIGVHKNEVALWENPKGHSVLEILRRTRERYREYQDLWSALGIGLGDCKVRPKSLLFIFFRNFITDPSLARAALVRWVGKL